MVLKILMNFRLYTVWMRSDFGASWSPTFSSMLKDHSAARPNPWLVPYPDRLSEDGMPYLQLDVTGHYPADQKRLLAAKMSETYARVMSVDIRRISVAIRELGDGGIWRIAEAGAYPTPASVMMLDIRSGRPPELRMALAKALCAHCIDLLGLREDRLNVEFTQHSGDEMYHPALGGFSPDWKPGEH